MGWWHGARRVGERAPVPGWGASMTTYLVRLGRAGLSGTGLATTPDGAEADAVGGLFGAMKAVERLRIAGSYTAAHDLARVVLAVSVTGY